MTELAREVHARLRRPHHGDPHQLPRGSHPGVCHAVDDHRVDPLPLGLHDRSERVRDGDRMLELALDRGRAALDLDEIDLGLGVPRPRANPASPSPSPVTGVTTLIFLRSMGVPS